MSLSFGLDAENGIEHSRPSYLQPACKGQAGNLIPLSGMPSNGAFQYTRQNFAYTTNLGDRRRILAAINKLQASLKKQIEVK